MILEYVKRHWTSCFVDSPFRCLAGVLMDADDVDGGVLAG